MFDERASKWVQNDPQAYKHLQILKAQVMSFQMIYNMHNYENVDFWMHMLQKWVQKRSSGSKISNIF